MSRPLRALSRTSLVEQAADAIKHSIAVSEWKGLLPSEGTLSEKLQIGRSTLRLALERLREEGLIEGGRGRRSRIVGKAATDGQTAPRRVAIASGRPLSQHSPTALVIIEKVQRDLHQAGYDVELHFESSFGARAPRKGIQEILARKAEIGCWLFLSPSLKIQTLLHEHSIGAVIAGSSFEGLDIPAIDESHHATALHAANKLIGKGHRSLALLISDSNTAGELACESGFLQGSSRDVVKHVARCAPGPEGVLRTMKRLFSAQRNPTALLVFHPPHIQTVMGFLSLANLKIPRDVSIIALNSENYLEYTVPPLARYAIDPLLYARQLYKLMIRVLKAEKVKPDQSYIWPKFIEGRSIHFLT